MAVMITKRVLFLKLASFSHVKRSCLPHPLHNVENIILYCECMAQRFMLGWGKRLSISVRF